MKRRIVCLLMIFLIGIAGCVNMKGTTMSVKNESVRITSGGENYPAYLAVPTANGEWPAVVLIHSFNGLEPGYKTMINNLASEGFVVIAPE